ncbi:MAG: accessory gene regulator B family protein [Lachnospiraceae bacterium]|nr:accessory gene regulator B family protein [Lachnospiraceae bacterium]
MDRLVNRSVTAMLEHRIISEEQKAVMIYGLDLLYSSIISLLSFVVLGFLMDCLVPTVVLLMFFIPLQSFGGGYHCQTHFRCWLLMMIGYIVAVFVLMNLPLYILWSGALIGTYAVLKFAPIENPAAPFGECFRKKMRKIMIVVFVVAVLLAGAFSTMRLELAVPILVAVILSEVSITSAKIKRVYMRN